MLSEETIRGIEVLNTEAKARLLSLDGYLKTVMSQPDSEDCFHVPVGNTGKPVCVLDVDNTLIYVRYFGDEMKAGDNIKFGSQPAVVEAVTYEVTVKETNKVTRDTNLATYFHRVTKTQVVPTKWSNFTYIVDDSEDEKTDLTPVQTSPVMHVEAVACEIRANKEIIEISFEEESPELLMLKPRLIRDGMEPVRMIHNGFLVRFRPDLSRFLVKLNEHFEVVLFTAAEEDVYRGLLRRAHAMLLTDLKLAAWRDTQLWANILFRSSCDIEQLDNGRSFHLKNLLKYQIDLSRIFIIDNNPLAFRGFEPNAICCGDFNGCEGDTELITSVWPICERIITQQIPDVRYALCDVMPHFKRDECDDEKHSDYLQTLSHTSPDIDVVYYRMQELNMQSSLIKESQISSHHRNVENSLMFVNDFRYNQFELNGHDYDSMSDSEQKYESDVDML